MINTLSILICFLHLVSPYHDRIGAPDKIKVQQLGAEVIADAIVKIQQTDGIRQDHSIFPAFEIGYIMGTIREKYRMMMELYRISLMKFTERSTLKSPRIEVYRPIHFFYKMEYVHLLEMEIDKLVDVLERMPEVDSFQIGGGGGGKVPPLSPEQIQSMIKPHFRASDDSSDDDEEKRVQLEEQVKSQYREQYLLTKLGSAAEHSTRKRFLDKWPVRGTWSLEQY